MRGVVKMNIRTGSEFLRLSRAPPLGWAVPRNERGKGITRRHVPPETCPLLTRLSSALPPGRFMSPYVPG